MKSPVNGRHLPHNYHGQEYFFITASSLVVGSFRTVLKKTAELDMVIEYIESCPLSDTAIGARVVRQRHSDSHESKAEDFICRIEEQHAIHSAVSDVMGITVVGL